MRSKSKNELRCFCAREPLLAVYGLDERGRVYLHIKIYKQSRIYGEVLITEGNTKIHCRECLRWHTVRIVQPSRVTLEESLPPRFDDSTPQPPSLPPPGTDN